MNKKLRRLLAICCMIFICLSTVNVPTVKAAEEDTSDDSLTFVEVIEEMPTQPSLSRAAKTKSATKTVYCNDSNGNTLWSLRIVATFSYTLPANAHQPKLVYHLIAHTGRCLCPVARDLATKPQQLQLEKSIPQRAYCFRQ